MRGCMKDWVEVGRKDESGTKGWRQGTIGGKTDTALQSVSQSSQSFSQLANQLVTHSRVYPLYT